MPNYEELRKKSCAYFYSIVETGALGPNFSEEDFIDNSGVGPTVAAAIFDGLFADRLIIQYSSGIPPLFRITREFLQFVDSIDEMNNNGVVPASDRTVTIDHNQPEVQETIQALGSVVEEAGKNNKFPDLFANPDDKTVFLSEFKSDIALLKDSTIVRVKSVVDRLVEPLKWIQEKLPDWTGSAFVSRALDLLENLLG